MKHASKVPKWLFSLLVLILLFNTGFSQEKTVTGMVLSAEDESTLPGVSIVIKGTTIGTITDIDGKFSISVPDNATLVFSFLGMETQEVAVEGKSTLNVTMSPDVLGLNEVVVIGYGEVKKSDATGSITTVSVKDFNRGSITSPQELLMGKTSGVQITTNSGAPGEGSTIRIRGGSSLSASNDPLIVVDGVPLDNEGIDGMRNPLNAINPDDIESFTVLKDASATAIFGSRASNGVIIITTKKGKIGAPLKLTYSTKFSLNTVAKTADVLSADEYKRVLQEQVEAGNIPDTALTLVGNANTDWMKEIYQNAFGQEHNLSASGSYMNVPYRISGRYSDIDGILKSDNIKRYTGSVNINPSLFDDHLQINANLKSTHVENFFADRGAIGAAAAFDPTHPVYNDTNYIVMDGNTAVDTTDYGGYWSWIGSDGSPVGLATSNPVALLEQREDVSSVNRTIANFQADYKLPFFPDLRANLNLGYDKSNSEGSVFVPRTATYEYESSDTSDGGTNRTYTQDKKNELLDFYLNYVKDIPGANSRIDATAGYSWQHFWRESASLEYNDYSTEALKHKENESDFATESYLLSFFGRVNYAYMDKYIVTATYRRDGSSRFSPDNRWGNFPSFALAWKLNKETFLKNVSVISNLKLRVGWGITGQQNIGQGDYPYLARYTFSEADAQYIFGSDTIVTARPDGYNAGLKWEETTTSNIALDYGFFKERIVGSLDFYNRKTTDLLNEIPVPAGTNFTNRVLSNIGTLVNKGFEFSITGRPIVKKDFFWELNFNCSYNQNEITKLTQVKDTAYLGIFTGGIAGGVGSNIQIHSTGYPSSSFYVYEQIYDQDGNPIEGLYVDRNDDGQSSIDDRYRLHKPAPDYIMGFGSRLEYKNWDFSFSGRVNLGNYVYNNVSSTQGLYTNMYHPNNYLNNVNAGVLESNFQTYQFFSDYYIHNASFLRMDNISLGYNIQNIVMDKLNIYVSATIQNVFVITKYDGIDPEIGNGIDNNIYPRPRIFLLGVNVEF